MDIEGNGKPKKYQVIVDRDQVDSSLSWETDVEKIINVYQDQEEHRYQGVVKWSNGTYSLHPNEELRKKCPEQLIDFYENHLYFRSS
ncbi:hypothetical protein BJ944DRAFT_262237 [Cunninghamella echinulata]|nr:hypothetical protein BJ944DRAFT_262237 [Cunninghamella echinulata]